MCRCVSLVCFPTNWEVIIVSTPPDSKDIKLFDLAITVAMQTKGQLAVLVLACIVLSQGAHFSLNITLTSDSPLNCSTGLTYPGPAFVRVEYRWLRWPESDGNNESLIPDQWSTLRTMNTCKVCIVFSTY